MQDKERLFKAIRDGKSELVNWLLDTGLSPDSRLDDEQKTPAVIYSLKCSKLKCLQILLEHKATVDAPDEMRMTAAMYAADTGKLEYLKLLQKFGANVDKSDSEGVTALMLSSQSGKIECVQFLLGEKVDINKKDRMGKSAIFYAAGQGEVQCLQHLIDKKAEINFCDHNQYSALMHALKLGELEAAQLLIDNNADVNFVGLDGKTAFTLAYYNSLGDYSIIEDLLLHGADLNLSPEDQSFLHIMVAKNHRTIVRRMVINGCPPTDRRCSDNCFRFNHHKVPISPLCVALLSGNDDIARYFIINRYFTSYDLFHLAKDIEFYQKINTSEDNEISLLVEYLEGFSYPLQDICLVAVRTLLNATPSSMSQKASVLSRWKLPESIQRQLLFTEPSSSLCVQCWQAISLERDQSIEICNCSDCEIERSIQGSTSGFKIKH
ncbi:serine/threonine-protein phosphatase 6 regulatory ankyrin repeat subunit C-like isoform X2 [Physella acuta]|nr:serine/threonine-protein phosphatase 6 regulatory ankyrin repeat subunit C-like isoform X2 [Physella acuta]